MTFSLLFRVLTLSPDGQPKFLCVVSGWNGCESSPKRVNIAESIESTLSVMSESHPEETLQQGTIGAASEDPALSLTLAALFENLDRLREFVGEQAEACGFESSAVYKIKLAADEAFTNIVEHAYGGECQENILCSCQTTEDELVVTLRDCGHPFDPTKVPEPDLHAELEEREIGGLGLFFIRKLMDEVSFTFQTEAGGTRKCNVLRMVKRKE